MLVSKITGIPYPTVSKVMKILANHNLVLSARGADGGYQLVEQALELSLGDLIEYFEGPIAVTACAVPGHQCELSKHCLVHPIWKEASHKIREQLNSMRIFDCLERISQQATIGESL